jgi:multicomponent Na+:H+ antiporter subunit F
MVEENMDMIPVGLDAVIYALVATSILSMLRVVFGPSPEDKMLGLNLSSAQVLAILVLIAVKLDRSVLLDVALVYAVLGFVGILAIARYFFRGENRK